MNSLITLFDIAKAVLDTGNRKTRVILGIAFTYLLVWIAAIYALACFGQQAWVVGLGCAALVIGVAVIILWRPIEALLVISTMHTPWYTYGVIVLGQLLVSLYLFFVPMGNAPVYGIAVILLIVASILVYGISQSRSGRVYTWIVKVCLILALALTIWICVIGFFKPATPTTNAGINTNDTTQVIQSMASSTQNQLKETFKSDEDRTKEIFSLATTDFDKADKIAQEKGWIVLVINKDEMKTCQIEKGGVQYWVYPSKSKKVTLVGSNSESVQSSSFSITSGPKGVAGFKGVENGTVLILKKDNDGP